MCDFCSNPDPRYVEDAREYTATEVEGQLYSHSEGGWASCQACHDLVGRRDWQRLEARAVRNLQRKYPWVPLDEIRKGIHTQHSRFRAHQS